MCSFEFDIIDHYTRVSQSKLVSVNILRQKEQLRTSTVSLSFCREFVCWGPTGNDPLFSILFMDRCAQVAIIHDPCNPNTKSTDAAVVSSMALTGPLPAETASRYFRSDISVKPTSGRQAWMICMFFLRYARSVRHRRLAKHAFFKTAVAAALQESEQAGTSVHGEKTSTRNPHSASYALKSVAL